MVACGWMLLPLRNLNPILVSVEGPELFRRSDLHLWGDPSTGILTHSQKKRTWKENQFLGSCAAWWTLQSEYSSGLSNCRNLRRMFEIVILSGNCLVWTRSRVFMHVSVIRHWLVKPTFSYSAHASTNTAQKDSLNAKRIARVHQPLQQIRAT